MIPTTQPIIYTTPSVFVPAEVCLAAETLHNFFAKEGHQNWQFMHVAARSVVSKLEQEKRELWDECVAMRKAIEVAFDALDDAKEQLKSYTN